MRHTAHLGTGMGWRPEIAEAVERMPGLDWVEVVAENVCPGHLPDSLRRLRERGVTVVPHGVGLGIGGAERPDPARLAALAERAEALGSPLVTEHIAFVRAGGELTASPRLEAGHLLPVPRTKDSLDVLCEHVRIAQDALPVPLALENIAALVAWPGEEMTEGQFLYDLADRTGVRLLIDVANLHTNHVNRGEDPCAALDELPVEAIAYVHVAGGFERDGVWHDSHAHPVTQPVLDVLAELASRVSPPGVLLERDENFPAPEELEQELRAIRRTLATGEARRLLPARTRTAAPARTRTATPARTPAVRERAAELVAVGRPSGAPLHMEPAAPEVTEDDSEREGEAEGENDDRSRTARQRLALAQAALLSALVAGTPAPEGFDRQRLTVQSRALTAKRADVIAKVAPELPVILGDTYRRAFFSYAGKRPMTGGYRRDALDFAEYLLLAGESESPGARRELSDWWLARSGPAPVSAHPVARFVRRARYTLTGR
ncbi:DUF692 domain-containing protein [Streptomyces boluensis]|uniref:DUF692 family protein n=1 Tax=Streptomyces boluensis TaxID=1775135 RepID=A0A964XLM2_9ACTN|nr:DUF692 domain-containing protein [Streptomyces boluensis]NBE51683.1 DUF692 family protein [Streptomyces boluensis]